MRNNYEPTPPPPLAESRRLFEEAVFADYFTRGIRFRPNKQFAELTNTQTKAELMTRDGESYKDDGIGAMWHGWKLARKEAR